MLNFRRVQSELGTPYLESEARFGRFTIQNSYEA